MYCKVYDVLPKGLPLAYEHNVPVIFEETRKLLPGLKNCGKESEISCDIL
jgi:hypothetical protein